MSQGCEESTTPPSSPAAFATRAIAPGSHSTSCRWSTFRCSATTSCSGTSRTRMSYIRHTVRSAPGAESRHHRRPPGGMARPPAQLPLRPGVAGAGELGPAVTPSRGGRSSRYDRPPWRNVTMSEIEARAERFESERARLRAIAYRMLGSLSEAEDAVQETWLRFSRSGSSGVENLGGWLTTVVARVCLDMLRSRKSRREEPFIQAGADPVALGPEAIDPEREAVLADSVGLALL